MRNTVETRIGIGAVALMLLGVVLLEVFQGGDFLRPGYDVHARFDNIYDLNVGAPVKLAGVNIGRVSRIGLDEERVVVTMKIDQGRRVRTSSTAQINFAGLVGQNFITLDFGNPDDAFVDPQAGGVLDTRRQPDLNILMAQLENVAKGVEDMTKSFSGDALQNVLGPAAEFMRDNSPRMAVILSNLEIVSQKVRDGEGTIGRMVMDDRLHDEAVVALRSVNRSAGKINSALTDMSSLTALARSSVNRLESGQGTMGLLLKDEALYRESTIAMVNLREMLEKMNTGEGTVGQLINQADFLAALTLTLQKVEKATDGLEDQGPLSIIGMAFGSFVKF